MTKRIDQLTAGTALLTEQVPYGNASNQARRTTWNQIWNLLTSLTAKTSLVDADEVAMTDSAASLVAKKITWANVKTTVITAFGAMLDTLTSKTTPVDGDEIVIADSAASLASKKVTWANIKATLKTYFDGLYVTLPRSIVRLPFANYGSMFPMATNQQPFSASLDSSVTLVKWTQSLYVAATNDGSNYWTISILRPTDNQVYASFTTAALAQATQVQVVTSSFTHANAVPSDISIVVDCQKHNSPGALTMYCPNVQIVPT